MAAYRTAVQLRPGYGQAHANLANCLRQLQRPEEAAAALEDAAKLVKDDIDLQLSLAAMQQQQGRMADAQATLERAIAARPDHAYAHQNYAMHLLLTGQFEKGWPEYEWRWKTSQRQNDRRNFREPIWDGTKDRGTMLLLHCEQGLGATIQFVRYAPLLAEQGYQVIVECQPPLKRLLFSLHSNVTVVGYRESLPAFDVHAALLSVPRLMKTTLANMPAGIPYLHAEPNLVTRWRNELNGAGRFKIGIAWQGNPRYGGDAQRSIPLRYFAPLSAINGVKLFSLQKGLGSEQLKDVSPSLPLIDLGPRLDGKTGAFVDSAAVMMNLDLVITSDTSIAHLAGALGVRVWVALCHLPDWRWLLDREDCPWYPTMRLFRQKRPGDWDEIFQRVANGLRSNELTRAGG